MTVAPSKKGSSPSVLVTSAVIVAAAVFFLMYVLGTPWGADDDRVKIELANSVDVASKAREYEKYDILGIRPGMPLSDARDIIDAELGGVAMKLGHSVARGEITSQPYDRELLFYSENGFGSVFGASPSAGNVVLSANRSIEFKNDNGYPSIDDVRALLVAKYGEPSWVKADWSGTTLAWYVGGSGKCESRSVCTETATTLLSTLSIDTDDGWTANAPDLIIVAAIDGKYPSRTQAGKLRVSFSEQALRSKSEAADRKALADAQAEFDKLPGKLPQL
ncbi:hypothetical protein G6L37_05345 [Agrobacterium rubi]|nr:hypothetical protein [Agrobacterium rubi]NTF24782.1 hypothetical protein [Agrobacterium rubi]